MSILLLQTPLVNMGVTIYIRYGSDCIIWYLCNVAVWKVSQLPCNHVRLMCCFYYFPIVYLTLSCYTLHLWTPYPTRLKNHILWFHPSWSYPMQANLLFVLFCTIYSEHILYIPTESEASCYIEIHGWNLNKSILFIRL